MEKRSLNELAVNGVACDVHAVEMCSIAKTRKLSVMALRSAARLLLRFLVFFHRLPLFFRRLFAVLLLLLRRSAGLASIFSDAPVLPLSLGRCRHGNAQSE